VLTWEELELAAPEIAAHGRELIERFQCVLVGTLTKDGSPRITPVEAYIVDGHLLANMIPGSLKARDLLRDPRVYVHAPVTAKEGSPEFKLAGRAEVLEDEVLRRKLDDLFWEMIQWRPAPRPRGGFRPPFPFRSEGAACPLSHHPQPISFHV
jgi:predicted pyridoxine 5'-phosphate oxidase superfamily flavin-nucleotide-binding protein